MLSLLCRKKKTCDKKSNFLMVCFAGMIVAWLIKTGRCYSSRADLIFRSLFLFISFTTPSGRHRQKEKSSVDHSLISYQITAIKQIPLHLPVCKWFPRCDEFIRGATQTFSSEKPQQCQYQRCDFQHEVTSELER